MKIKKRALFFPLAVVVLALAGLGMWLPGLHADKPSGAIPEKTITVYTTMPDQTAAILAQAYEKSTGVAVQFAPFGADELLARLGRENAKPVADLVVADARTLRRAATAGYFVPYETTEFSDSVPERFFGADDAWIGLWYDPMVFCVNADFMARLARMPLTWGELASAQNVRIGLTDFLAAEASANMLMQLVGTYGEQTVMGWLRAMNRQVTQYAKYLNTPARMAGMGEVDIAVAVASEAYRYVNQDYPIKLIFPHDGTAYLLTGAGMTREGEKGRPAHDFAEWLLSDEAQLVMRSQDLYFTPVISSSLAGKSLAVKNPPLLEPKQTFNSAERYRILDDWVKNVRFDR